MKKNIVLITVIVMALLLGGFTSCSDFLEMPPQTSFNIDSVFSKYQNAEKLVFDLYQYEGKALATAHNGKLNNSSVADITDEAICFTAQNGYTANRVYAGSVTSSWFTVNGQSGEDIYDNHWKTIRKAFILNANIDRVPDATTEVKERIKGECLTMIALEYFEMFIRYGGVPIVRKSLNEGSEYAIVRSPLDSVYNYIIKLCDQAIANPYFPAKVPDEKEFGRLTKAFAYGLKAKTMLYAASPLFNSDRPYMDFGANNKLICFMGYDKNRWQQAADAAKEAIKYCESNGYGLVTSFGINKNYKVACEDRPKFGNTEVIFGTYQGINIDKLYWTGRGTNVGGYSPTEPTQNQVEKYQNTDGSNVDWSKTITTPPNDPTYPYKNLDPRFQQSIAYNGCLWITTPPTYNLEIYDGVDASVTNGRNGPTMAKTQFAYFPRKFLNGYELPSAPWTPLSIYMRLAELYLIEAEALNEVNGPTEEAFLLLDAIRNRSGMPNVPRSLNQAELRKFIENERSVELFLENHRYFDVKRLKIGEVFMGPIYDVRVIKQKNGSYTYTKYKYQDRAWFNHWYLEPFPYSEVNKGYGLIQNPGW
ncbi:MAG: RagB/SusD family nutrient uptake outer membrane protein [Bacteroidota bacterium]|nr:RagB/SusD family nutrient uptake outer membrane protein [Bacteroidota bacterium]MDP4225325.1 RagB/SusD family nutrient uptake outer membrane protein [Bacteroidota bacterium]MDP4273024.1 RagB/SusD family nutrient uptake outer membrane protein [Bacteroidota bacterium]